MRKLLVPFCLFSQLLFAQKSPLDSLEQRFLNEKSDAQKLEILSEMVGTAFQTDLKTALFLAKKGVALAEKTSDQNALPKFQEMQGRMHANLGQLDSASLFFEKAMTGYSTVGNKKGQATIFFKLAWVAGVRGDHEKALARNLDALRIMENLGDQKGIASALGRISGNFYNQEKAAEALNYAQKSIEICQKNGFQGELAFSFRFAGDASLMLGDFEKSLLYYDKMIAIGRSEKMGPLDMADFSNARGNALKKVRRFDEALFEYKNCLALAEKASYAGGISTAIANLAEINLLLGRPKEALHFQLETIKMQQENGDLSNLTESLGRASSIYEQLGDFRNALFYEKKARKMRDSTASIQSDAAMSKLKTEYETEKNEATISAQDAQISQQKKVQWLGLGVAGLLAFLALTFWKNAAARKKTNQLLAAKNAENELLLKEIHHRVKNNLEVVSSLLALQSARIDDPNVKNAMQEGQNRVASISIVHQKLYQGTNLGAIEMRDYFLNLSENILDTFGADGRIQIECAMEALELDIDTAVPLGLIVNEILTNALKYAFPDGRKGQISVKLIEKQGKILHLEIADNGIGKTGLTRGTGFGTQLVSLLAQQLGGKLEEKNDGGTVVFIDFQMRKAA